MWILSVYFPEKVVIMMQMWTSQHKGDITTLNLYIIPLNMSFKITLALFFFFCNRIILLAYKSLKLISSMLLILYFCSATQYKVPCLHLLNFILLV